MGWIRLGEFVNLMTRTQPNILRLSRRPSNQFNLTNPPTATLSNDSGNQMRVPNSITLPHVSRSLVFCFKTRDTRPKSNLYPFRLSIMNFRLDPVRSCRYLTKSRLDLNKSDHISALSRQIQPDLDGSG